jgi:SPP1 family predicted phage head-tail adaptor
MSLRRLSGIPPASGGYTPIGARQNRVTLYTPGGRDASSGKTLAPTVWGGGDRWCAMRALNGAELYKAQQIAQTVTQLLVLSYEPGISENMTVKTSDGRTLQIRFIEDPDSRGVDLWLYCDETGQNAGQQ